MRFKMLWAYRLANHILETYLAYSHGQNCWDNCTFMWPTRLSKLLIRKRLVLQIPDVVQSAASMYYLCSADFSHIHQLFPALASLAPTNSSSVNSNSLLKLNPVSPIFGPIFTVIYYQLTWTQYNSNSQLTYPVQKAICSQTPLFRTGHKKKSSK